MVKSFLREKRGWVRIVEAAVAILIITGVVLVVLDKGYVPKEDLSNQIYFIEEGILREIQTNDSLREEILDPALNPPVKWNDTDFPLSVINKIETKAPTYLECEAKICDVGSVCSFEKNIVEDVYSRAVLITTTKTAYSPRTLRIFCWRKE